MSKLVITRYDVETALKQYYKDYQTDLFDRYDFEHIDMYYGDKKLGYLDVEFVIDEKPEGEEL